MSEEYLVSLGGEEGDTEGERDPPREVKPLETTQLVSIFSESGSIVLPQCSRSPHGIMLFSLAQCGAV